jgi:D-alanyl-D-alanine-carboxypeptidase/D-alanyl-D-alanine-endopeptidase
MIFAMRKIRMKKSCTISCSIVLSLALVMMTCSSEDPVEPEITFNSFSEEVQYLIESNFTFGGVAVGVIKGDTTFTLFHGTRSENSHLPPDENTVYEMGSVTKTFTATLLADFVVNERIGLHDNVQSYLPADSVMMPTYNGIEISFWHLATHTSALPKNFSDEYPLPAYVSTDDPFNLITAEHVYDYLNHYVTLTRAPGVQYEYSNFGVGFLGFVLSRINQTTYESLLKTTILDVLNMDRTSIQMTDEQMNNVAVGYDSQRNEVTPWGSDHILVGCGSLKSTLNDMMAYVKANMGLLDSSLNDAITLALQPQFANYVCLCWFLEYLDDGQIIQWHGGAAAGHITFIGFNRSMSTGVVILYNWTASLLPVEIGMRIFEIAGRYQE